jgi:hypothetical protein
MSALTVPHRSAPRLARVQLGLRIPQSLFTANNLLGTWVLTPEAGRVPIGQGETLEAPRPGEERRTVVPGGHHQYGYRAAGNADGTVTLFVYRAS